MYASMPTALELGKCVQKTRERCALTSAESNKTLGDADPALCFRDSNAREWNR